MNTPVKNIVVAGGGTAGWMAAALLSKVLGRTVNVTLIESDAIPTVGVGEATIPPLATFHQMLELDEREFVSAVNGTFKLGIQFENWRQQGHKYIHSFGFAGQDCWACSFVHFWLAGKARGIDYSYSDYCVELAAAEQGKFAVLPDGRMNYAYHLDAGRYAKLLRAYSEKRGVVRREGMIREVITHAQTGNIASLVLESGEQVDGDFFIDCTGFKGLLIDRALNVGYEDWSHWLPCDRAIAVQTEQTEAPMPFTRSIAHDAGWQWRIPLQNRAGNGLVYASRFCSEEHAEQTLLKNIQGEPINDLRHIPFRTGTRREHWHKNCLALGLASGFLEPLESTSIHLIQKSLTRFVQLFPADGVSKTEVDEFNRQTRRDIERIRDFIILHYKVTERDDSPFWRYCRNMDIPDTLAEKIDLFRESGRVFKVNNELFGEESWTQVMLGQGINPASWHPVADNMGGKQLEEFLAGLRRSTAGLVQQLPAHQDFIQYFCGGRPAATRKTAAG